MKSNTLAPLEQQLGYFFTDKDKLVLALTHRSCGTDNNERLEFLGDAIVNFIVAEALYKRFPQAKEGQLSRLRACLVRGTTLAELGREFNLGQFLRLGSGEMKSGGERRDSILADAIEAIIGAMYLDGGMSVCHQQVHHWFADRLATLSITDQQNNKDPKTRLQEYLQAHQQNLPRYWVTAVTGADHDQHFTVACALACLQQTVFGTGTSRKSAEQQAAQRALALLDATQ